MTFPPDPGRGAVLDDVAKAVALLTAIEDILLDSDDPQMVRDAHRVHLALRLLEEVR
jgi:hypothetical protein